MLQLRRRSDQEYVRWDHVAIRSATGETITNMKDTQVRPRNQYERHSAWTKMRSRSLCESHDRIEESLRKVPRDQCKNSFCVSHGTMVNMLSIMLIDHVAWSCYLIMLLDHVTWSVLYWSITRNNQITLSTNPTSNMSPLLQTPSQKVMRMTIGPQICRCFIFVNRLLLTPKLIKQDAF